LFEGDESWVSTSEFHSHRPRAPHLEQEGHQQRLHTAARFVNDAIDLDGEGVTVSDLGCGDGGLLSLVKDLYGVTRAWGYDFQPSNQAGWQERGVTAYLKDVFGSDRDEIQFGRVTVMTEVLEHLTNPHGEVAWVAQNSNYLVASSPYDESDLSHDECHAWAWDVDGYRALIEQGGFRVIRHKPLDWKFQVILAVRDGYAA
jgi:hypothetical protein